MMLNLLIIVGNFGDNINAQNIDEGIRVEQLCLFNGIIKVIISMVSMI